MALEAEVNELAVRLSEIIHEFAKGRGWEPESYRIFMTFNRANYAASLLIVSEHLHGFEDAEEQDLYDDLMDIFEREFADDPKIYQSIGLVFWPFDMYGFQSHEPDDPDRISIPDTLINPGVKDLRGPFLKYAAQPDRP